MLLLQGVRGAEVRGILCIFYWEGRGEGVEWVAGGGIEWLEVGLRLGQVLGLGLG